MAFWVFICTGMFTHSEEPFICKILGRMRKSTFNSKIYSFGANEHGACGALLNWRGCLFGLL